MSLLFLHKVTGVRKNKPYLPSWRSGPYAILLALHKESQKPNYPGNNHVCTGGQISKSFISYYLYQQLHICAGHVAHSDSDCLQARRSGIESWWGQDVPPIQTGPGAHPASCKMGTRSLLGVKCGRGVVLTIHPVLVPQSYLCPPSGPHQACNGNTLLNLHICALAVPIINNTNEQYAHINNRGLTSKNIHLEKFKAKVIKNKCCHRDQQNV